MSETTSTATTTSTDTVATPAPAAKKTAAKRTATKRAAKTEVSASGSKTEKTPAFKPVKLVRKGVTKTAYSKSEQVALEFDGYRAK